MAISTYYTQGLCSIQWALERRMRCGFCQWWLWWWGHLKGTQEGTKIKTCRILEYLHDSVYVLRWWEGSGELTCYQKTRGQILGVQSLPPPLHCSLSRTVWSIWRWASVKGGCLLSHLLDTCHPVPAHTLSEGPTTSLGAVKKDRWHSLDTQFHCPTNPF